MRDSGDQPEPYAPAEEQNGEPASGKAERLGALASRASVCVACRLAETRTHVVFGEGNPDAPLMLIGEGPGAQEDATGRPFVGRAGKLLDECLRECGMSRKHVYICNIVRCRACDIVDGRPKNRPPAPDEAAACSQWLEPTIDTVKPLVILCLGATAASSIIHKGFKMMQERGQWFESKYALHASATLHPAYVLRQMGASFDTSRRTLAEDLDAARKKVIEARKQPNLTLF